MDATRDIDPSAIRPGDCAGICGEPRRVLRTRPDRVLVRSFAPGGGEIAFAHAFITEHWIPAGEVRT